MNLQEERARQENLGAVIVFGLFPSRRLSAGEQLWSPPTWIVLPGAVATATAATGLDAMDQISSEIRGARGKPILLFSDHRSYDE